MCVHIVHTYTRVATSGRPAKILWEDEWQLNKRWTPGYLTEDKPGLRNNVRRF